MINTLICTTNKQHSISTSWCFPSNHLISSSKRTKKTQLKNVFLSFLSDFCDEADVPQTTNQL